MQQKDSISKEEILQSVKETYTFEDFVQIVRILRCENGCSWDREQTHESLKSCMMNEAAEVVEGIDLYQQSGDADNLCEELGDVLLQVVLHSQIGKEEGAFTLDDVIQGISEKMVRRHPHVFGQVKDGEQPSWEEIKRLEKESKKTIEIHPEIC